ncbi:MAG: MerR family transcriptional regulator [Candidatus Muirbacterium halophilum]|nr:MerR family transcriptional regulator [Candidatus Muirbacterium halophilum]MCK9474737.1 MerR family transcriptional regulator [Candidatus Muirbacterium halophilum]
MDKEIRYTIGEVSQILGINPSKVRFWMKQFPEYLTCLKTQGGQRRFSHEDYLKLKRVVDLTDFEKLTLDGVRNRLIIEKNRKGKLKSLVSKIYTDFREGVSEDIVFEKIAGLYL